MSQPYSGQFDGVGFFIASLFTILIVASLWLYYLIPATVLIAGLWYYREDSWPRRGHLIAPGYEAAAKMAGIFAVSVMVILSLPNDTVEGRLAIGSVAVMASAGILALDRYHRGDGILTRGESA